MADILEGRFTKWKPCAYMGGSAIPTTLKFLVTLNVGSKAKLYGNLGPKTVEITQMFYHLLHGKYFEFLRNPVAGKKLFLLFPFDRELRKALCQFLLSVLRNPYRLFDKIYTQSISLQQPNEILEGKVNLCDSCVNMMAYKGDLINSCRLDEYRIFGDAVMPILRSKGEAEFHREINEAPDRNLKSDKRTSDE